MAEKPSSSSSHHNDAAPKEPSDPAHGDGNSPASTGDAVDRGEGSANKGLQDRGRRKRGAKRRTAKVREPKPAKEETSTAPGHTHLEPVTRRDARRLLKHGRKLLRRHKGKLDARKVAEVDRGLSELYDSLIGTDQETLTEAYHRADRRLERHLGFAQKGVFREYAESIVLAVLFAFSESGCAYSRHF